MVRLSATNRVLSGRGANRSLPVAVVYLSPFIFLVAALLIGRYPIVPFDERARMLLIGVRAPRVIGALLIGGSLGLTGVVLQALFRNPLVDANILGVSSGAGFGAALALLVGAGAWMVRSSALVFGLVAVAVTVVGARRYIDRSRLMVTLMGILVAALFGSLTSLLKYLADPLDTLPRITFWLLGSLSTIGWRADLFVAIVTAVGVLVAVAMRWRINVLSLDEAEIVALGIDPARIRLLFLILASVLTAAAVSVSGVIGWVGLVTPHAGRALVGADHRRLVPVSLALGASFLIVLDTIARSAFPAEIPIGVLSGIVGVPLFIAIIRRRGERW